MSETQLPVPVIQYDPAATAKLSSFLQRAHTAGVEELAQIVKIENDEQYDEAEATLSEIKSLYDKMSEKRKAFTDPIKEALTAIMVYENDFNPNATKENAYLKARKVLENYNQQKIEVKRQAEAEAYMRAETIKYESAFKAEISKQLADMIAGKERTVINGMAQLEKSLTLENFSANIDKTQKQVPTLKREDYDKCFRRWGQKPEFMHPEAEDAFLLKLKEELTYDIYNAKYQQLIGPIKNAFLARVDEMHERLKKQAAANEAEQVRLKKQEEERIARETQEQLAAAKKREEKVQQEIIEEKDLGHMEADFTQQAMTADVEAGPSKKEFSFENNSIWLKALVGVITKCAIHPKFKGIMKANGEYVPEVQKWLDFYSANIAEDIPGMTYKEVAKTAIRKKV